MDEVKRVRELVSYFHLPIFTGLQFVIEALQKSSRSSCRFVPSRVPVREFRSDQVGLGMAVKDVEEVSRHTGTSAIVDVLFRTDR